MLINNIDPLVSFNAKLISRDIMPAETITYKDWLRKSLNPLVIAQAVNYISITLKYLITCAADMQALNNISNLVNSIRQSTIKFEDIDFYYDVVLTDNGATTERFNESSQGQFILTLELEAGYAYKSALIETLDHVSSKTINVSGNQSTPAIVTVIVSQDTSSLTLSGLSQDPITLKNLKANTPVIIDGEACTVLQEGTNKFPDTDMWEFPTLQPGANNIQTDNANCTIQIQYKPKWI